MLGALSPPEAAAEVQWHVLPSVEAPDAEGFFNQAWGGLLSTVSEVQAQAPRQLVAEAGHEVRGVYGCWTGQDGRSVHGFFAVAQQGTFAQPTLLLAASHALLDVHAVDVVNSINSIRFLAPKRRQPPPARSPTPDGWTLQDASVPAASSASLSAPAPAGPASLVGKWGFVSSNGSQSYEFSPKGDYTFSQLIQSQLINCKLSVFIYQSGRYKTQGDKLRVPGQAEHRFRAKPSSDSGARCPRDAQRDFRQ